MSDSEDEPALQGEKGRGRTMIELKLGIDPELLERVEARLVLRRGEAQRGIFGPHPRDQASRAIDDAGTGIEKCLHAAILLECVHNAVDRKSRADDSLVEVIAAMVELWQMTRECES
ncbi:MAG: hypothetical protein ABIH46_11310 [Chloroflexota bacterium]